MLTIRPFCNRDCNKILHLWEKKREEFPDFFVPLTMEILESQILGNVLFDRNGFLFACEGDQALGMVHAAFVPNVHGTGESQESGIIFSPIVLPELPNRFDVTCRLILAAEEYLKSRNAKHWFAGGYGSASPFYTALYGRGNPEGILADDEIVISAFEEAGCRSIGRSRLFQMNLNDFRLQMNNKIHEANRLYTVQGYIWNAGNWWETNIYRNFTSTEWIVLQRSDKSTFPNAVAGALVHRMIKNVFTMQKADGPIHMVLSYIGVVPQLLRMGIASFLFNRLAGDILGEETFPVILDTIVPERDVRLAAFLSQHGFQEQMSVVAMQKKEDSLL